MLRFEIKKIWSRPVNKAALLLLAVIVLTGSALAARDVVYYKADGSKISGFFAARRLRSEKNEWKGYVTEDVLKKMVKENQKACAQAESEDFPGFKRHGCTQGTKLNVYRFDFVNYASI